MDYRQMMLYSLTGSAAHSWLCVILNPTFVDLLARSDACQEMHAVRASLSQELLRPRDRFADHIL